VCLIRCRNCFPFVGAWVHLQFWWALCCSSFLYYVLCFLLCLSSSCVLCIQCCQILWIVNSWCGWQFSWNQHIHSKLHGIHSSIGKTIYSYGPNHNDLVVLTICRIIHGKCINSYLLNKEEWSECIPSNSNYSLKHIIIDSVDVKHQSIK